MLESLNSVQESVLFNLNTTRSVWPKASSKDIIAEKIDKRADKWMLNISNNFVPAMGVTYKKKDGTELAKGPIYTSPKIMQQAQSKSIQRKVS